MHSLDLTAQDFQQLQEEDSSLEAVRVAADGGVSTAGQGFFKRDGLMYRQWTPLGRVEKLEMDQLIVPKKMQNNGVTAGTRNPLSRTPRKRNDSTMYSPAFLLAYTRDVKQFL